MMRYVRTVMLLLAGLSFMIPLLSKPLLAKHWSEDRWSTVVQWKHADIDWTSSDPVPVDDAVPCIEPGQ